MKRTILFLSVLFTVTNIFSQTLSEFVIFEIQGNQFFARRNPEMSQDLYLDYFCRGRLVSRTHLEDAAQIINLNINEDDNTFYLDVIEIVDENISGFGDAGSIGSDESGGSGGGTDPLIIRMGPATLDDIDIKMLDMNDDQILLFLEEFCKDKTIDEDYVVQGITLKRSCYCKFMKNYATYEKSEPQSVYLNYIEPTKLDAYASEQSNWPLLANHMIDFCSSIKEEIGHGENRLANPSTIVNIIDNDLSINTYDMMGKDLSIHSINDLSKLSAGMYLIKQYNQGEITTIKYIVE